MINTRSIGSDKERLAAEYLNKIDIEIICMNYRIRESEIDIIAVDGEYLCFIEVKFRKSNRFGYPEEAVTLGKMKKICRCAKYFIYKHREYSHLQMRFDVLAILDGSIKYYKNAFMYVE